MPKYHVLVMLDKILTADADDEDAAILQVWERVVLNGLYWANFKAYEIKQEENKNG